MGRDGSRYWKAFGWTMAASFALYVGVVIALIAILGAAVATTARSAPGDVVVAAPPAVSNSPDPATSGSAAVDAAKRAVVDLTSYSPQTAASVLAKAGRELTPGFLTTYTKTFTQLESAIRTNDVVSIATVRAAGLESMEGANATVTITLDQLVTSKISPTPRTNEDSVEVRLVRQENGDWLVSNLAVVR